LLLEHWRRAVVGADQAKTGIPPAVCHLPHSDGDACMDRGGVEAGRQCKVREIDRPRLLAHEQNLLR
jgi:hypothetical protein